MARTVAERADTLPALAEVFREHGYSGASLSVISGATGLGKGSLYNFFPGGKSEMLAAVLEDVERWFMENVFEPLAEDVDPAFALNRMFASAEDYFHSGQRVCLIGSLALNDPDDLFALAVSNCFRHWITALAATLERGGYDDPTGRAEEIVVGIQGAIILTRGMESPDLFRRQVSRLKRNLGISPAD